MSVCFTQLATVGLSVCLVNGENWVIVRDWIRSHRKHTTDLMELPEPGAAKVKPSHWNDQFCSVMKNSRKDKKFKLLTPLSALALTGTGHCAGRGIHFAFHVTVNQCRYQSYWKCSRRPLSSSAFHLGRLLGQVAARSDLPVRLPRPRVDDRAVFVQVTWRVMNARPQALLALYRAIWKQSEVDRSSVICDAYVYMYSIRSSLAGSRPAVCVQLVHKINGLCSLL